MKKAFVLLMVLLVVLLIPAAYLRGLWRDRELRLALEGEVGILQRRLEETQARVWLCGLLAELQGLMDVVAQKNYGQAQRLSSGFFDHARVELGRTPQPAFKDALEAVLSVRDPVTVALTRSDPATLVHLKQAEGRLKGALGHPPPAALGAPPDPTLDPTLDPTPDSTPDPTPDPTPATTPATTPAPSPAA